MEWTTVAEGPANQIGGTQLEAGTLYRLTIWTPFRLPDVLWQPVIDVLTRIGVNVDSLGFYDNSLVLTFYFGALPGPQLPPAAGW